MSLSCAKDTLISGVCYLFMLPLPAMEMQAIPALFFYPTESDFLAASGPHIDHARGDA